LTAVAATVEDAAGRRGLAQLGFELCAALWSVEARAEQVCLRCGGLYLPTGLLGCPVWRDEAA